MQELVCDSFFGRKTIKNQFEQEVVDWFEAQSDAILSYDNQLVIKKTVAATKLLCELYANESVPKSEKLNRLLERTIMNSIDVVKKLLKQNKAAHNASNSSSVSSGTPRKRSKRSEHN